jgi:hypothetical protein
VPRPATVAGRAVSFQPDKILVLISSIVFSIAFPGLFLGFNSCFI